MDKAYSEKREWRDKYKALLETKEPMVPKKDHDALYEELLCCKERVTDIYLKMQYYEDLQPRGL